MVIQPSVRGFVYSNFVDRFVTAFVLVLVIVMMPMPSATASTILSWYDQALTQATASQFTSMNAVSCPTATFCAAGGSYTIANGRVGFLTTFNGTSWTAHSVGVSLASADAVVTAVSCVSSSFCLAGGNYVSSTGATLAFVSQWNGIGWSDEALPSPLGSPKSDSINTVSCVVGPFCVVGGGYLDSASRTTTPFVSVFEANQWTGQTFDLNDVPTSPTTQLAAGAIRAVSCLSDTFCIAGGSYGDASNYGGGSTTEPILATWNGVRWSAQQIAMNVNTGHSGSVTALSCASTTFCIAAGNDAIQQPGNQSVFVSSFDGAAWTSSGFSSLVPESSALLLTSESLPAVSCTATPFCVVVGSYQSRQGTGTHSAAFAEMIYPNGGFALPLETTLPPTGGAAVTAVSCVSSTFCVAGGHDSPVEQSVGPLPSPTFAFVSVWNGGAWHDQPVASSFVSASNAAVQAVSCAAADVCQVVGNYLDDGNNQQDFASSNALLTQTPLTVSAPTKASVGRRVFLTTSGGSGTVAPTFSVVGNHCLLDSALLIATQATTCVVVARNAANGSYAAVSSPPVSIAFALQLQRPVRLRISTVGAARRPLGASVTGGSGNGAVRLIVTGAGCSVQGRFVFAANPTLCTVRAVKAASGTFAGATSTPVVVSFH